MYGLKEKSPSVLALIIIVIHAVKAEDPEGKPCPETYTYIPSEYDCHTFYACKDGKDGTLQWVKYECPYIYDPINFDCVGGNREDCDKPTPPTIVEPGKPCTEKYEVKPSGTDCTSYFVCNFGDNGELEWMKYECPEGEIYDLNTHECREGNVEDCPITTPPTTDPEGKPCTEKYDSKPSEYDCTTYYVCKYNRDETLIWMKYECNGGGIVFDPNVGDCVAGNPEDCDKLTTTANPPTPVEPGMPCTEEYEYKPSEYDCTTYFVCEHEEDGTLTWVKYECYGGDVVYDPNVRDCVGGNPADCDKPTIPPTPLEPGKPCTEKYEVKPSGTDCTSYFVCNFGDNGELEWMKYECPEGEIYDLNTHECREGNIEDCPLTPPPVKPGEPCTEKYDSKPSGYDCTTFFVCDVGENGELEWIKHECPDGELFNPNIHECREGNVEECPITTPPTTDLEGKPCTEKYEVKPSGTDCTSYFVCNFGDNGELEWMKYECPEGEIYDRNTHECEEGNADDCPLTPPPVKPGEPCTEKYDSKPSGYDCTTFFVCDVGENGELEWIKHECPDGELFNPNIHECREGNVEDCPITTPPTTDPEGKPCTEKYDSKPSEYDCTTYYVCEYGKDETLIWVKYECYGGDIIFDPNVGDCVAGNPEDCEKLTTTANPLTPVEPGMPCTEEYEYKPSEYDCTTYFVCEHGEDGTLTWVKYECSGGDIVFDPNVRDCVAGNPEDCDKPTIPPTPVEPGKPCTEEHGIKPSEYDCHTYFVCEYGEDGTLTWMKDECSGVFDPNIGDCVAGNHEDCDKPTTPMTPGKPCNEEHDTMPSETDCTIYFTCTLGEDGTLTYVKHECYGGQIFDPNIRDCVSGDADKCPKDNISTTTPGPLTPTTEASGDGPKTVLKDYRKFV